MTTQLATVRKSMALDRSVLAARALSLPTRAKLIFEKVRALAAIAFGQPYTMRIGNLSFTVVTISDLRTFESCIVDFCDEIVQARVLRDGDRPVLVDIGANIGQWSAAAKLYYPGAVVLSVEPDPIVYERLRRNLTGQSVWTRQTAVAAEAGETLLYRHELSVMSALKPSADNQLTVRVPVTRLDDLASDFDHVELLRIDVEGGELEVLAGGTTTLRRSRFLLVELSLDRGPQQGLKMLEFVKRSVPEAGVIRFGRPLRPRDAHTCQDALICLHPNARDGGFH